MGGRPPGPQFFDKTGDLYIADAYLGLMKVGPDGGEAEVLATEADDGVPFHFVNGLDVDQATGDVYSIDSSTTYLRRFNTEIMMNADAMGRLLRYERADQAGHRAQGRPAVPERRGPERRQDARGGGAHGAGAGVQVLAEGG